MVGQIPHVKSFIDSRLPSAGLWSGKQTTSQGLRPLLNGYDMQAGHGSVTWCPQRL